MDPFCDEQGHGEVRSVEVEARNLVSAIPEQLTQRYEVAMLDLPKILDAVCAGRSSEQQVHVVFFHYNPVYLTVCVFSLDL